MIAEQPDSVPVEVTATGPETARRIGRALFNTASQGAVGYVNIEIEVEVGDAAGICLPLSRPVVLWWSDDDGGAP